MAFVDALNRMLQRSEAQLAAMEAGRFRTHEKQPGAPLVDTTERSKVQVRQDIEELRRLIESAEKRRAPATHMRSVRRQMRLSKCVLRNRFTKRPKQLDDGRVTQDYCIFWA